MGYENTTRNDFQTWPFKGQYSFVSSSHSCELNLEIWSYHPLGSLCVFWIEDKLGLKCFRRTSEPKGLPFELAVVQPFPLSSLDWEDHGDCEPKAGFSWGWDVVMYSDVSGQDLCFLSVPRTDLRLSPVFYQLYCGGIFASKKNVLFQITILPYWQN